MSNRWPGGIINGTAPVPTGGGAGDSAPGIWTLDQADQYIATQEWPGTGIPDPQFQYVTALLHGDGTNGGQNNTFLDSSPNNFTITRNGNTTQGSFSPYGNLWSNSFGTGNFLTVSTAVIPTSGSATWTVEGFVFPTSTTGNIMFVTQAIDGSASRFSMFIFENGTIGVFRASTNIITTTVTVALNTWSHIAITRNGSTFTVWINGVSAGTGTNSNAIDNTATKIGGIFNGNGQEFKGYISNLRINNTVVYSSTFTPSTEPLTAISGTQLLTCQSNRFRDISSNNYTITPSGAISVQRFSPFQNLATYQPAVIGGSGYFDGTGDYLTTPAGSAFAYGTGDFTVEGWFYATANSPQYGATLFAQTVGGTNYFWVSLNDDTANITPANKIQFTFATSGGGTSALSGATTFNLNTWNHFAAVRSSGSVKCYLNGVGGTAVTCTQDFTNTSYIPTIGRYTHTATNHFTGFLSQLRVVKSAVYTGNFTPSTAPLTAITNTSLLTNFTNGAIFDSDASNNFETVGNAQISTSVVKYGTGSMLFDGTGDSLVAPLTAVNALGSGNFTFEGWYYSLDSGASLRCMFDNRVNSSSNSGLFIRENSGGFVVGKGATNLITTTTGRVANTWQHIAVVRVGSIISLYVNGNLSATVSDAQNFTDQNRRISGFVDTQASPFAYNGYMDDIRITNGYARYWYNFQPPTRAFPNYGGTEILPPEDPLFENVTLLLNGNGTNGAQNNTFLDSSTNNFTITRNGNTTQGSFSPYGSLWSNFFNGSTDNFTWTGTALGSGNLTVEGWIFPTAATANGCILDASNSLMIRQNTNGMLLFSRVIGSTILSTTSGLVINSWNHIAVVRNSGTITLYVNGLNNGSASNTNNFTGTGFLLGRFIDGPGAVGDRFAGNISNFRITNTAVYTSDFTPSATPLTAVSGTSFLTCQSNRFVDNSSNAYAISIAGSPSVQRFSPFEPTAPYSTSVIGGSGYFDGSGDYLSFATAAGVQLTNSTAFTIEFWINPSTIPSTGGSAFVLRAYNINSPFQGYGIAFGGNTLNTNLQWWDGTAWTSIGAVSTSSWTHVAISYEGSGTTRRFFINGVLQGSAGTVPSSINYTAGTYQIGARNADFYLTGFISDFRLVNGTAVYTSAFTPPTAPVTAITNTQLLTNFTNAGIPDLAMQNNLETVGNAQVSTAQSKFGGSSLAFDGTGDYCKFIGGVNSIVPSLGNFTCEAWVYPTVSTGQNIFYFNGNNNTYATVRFDLTSSNTAYLLSTTTGGSWIINSGNIGSVPLNTWTHVAVVRNGGTISVYINGTSVYSSTAISATTKLLEGSFNYIGAMDNSLSSQILNYFNGNIQDLRITKGIARYVQPFTPPTQAFQTY